MTNLAKARSFSFVEGTATVRGVSRKVLRAQPVASGYVELGSDFGWWLGGYQAPSFSTSDSDFAFYVSTTLSGFVVIETGMRGFGSNIVCFPTLSSYNAEEGIWNFECTSIDQLLKNIPYLPAVDNWAPKSLQYEDISVTPSGMYASPLNGATTTTVSGAIAGLLNNPFAGLFTPSEGGYNSFSMPSLVDLQKATNVYDAWCDLCDYNGYTFVVNTATSSTYLKHTSSVDDVTNGNIDTNALFGIFVKKKTNGVLRAPQVPDYNIDAISSKITCSSNLVTGALGSIQKPSENSSLADDLPYRPILYYPSSSIPVFESSLGFGSYATPSEFISGAGVNITYESGWRLDSGWSIDIKCYLNGPISSIKPGDSFMVQRDLNTAQMGIGIGGTSWTFNWSDNYSKAWIATNVTVDKDRQYLTIKGVKRVR